MKSIRTFLIVVILSAMVLLLFVATIQGYRAGTQRTEALLDRHLTDRAQLIAASPNLAALNSDDEAPRFQVFDARGDLLQRSVDAPDVPMLALGGRSVGDATFAGDRWRVVNYHAPDGFYVLVAERARDRFSITEGIVEATLVPIVLVVPVLAILIWIIVTLGLRHLRTLAREVAARSSDNLSPIAIEDVPSELSPLITNMNGMLARVRHSYEREKQFASDAAHELRTPVSALKLNSYNLGTILGKDEPNVLALTTSLDRMSHLIEQLLLLYRTTSDQLRGAFEPIELRALCQQVITEKYPVIAGRHQTIELDGEACTILGNRFALSAMLMNLLDNASKYTPEGGDIRVALIREVDCISLQVEDSGMGIAESIRDRVVERFYRANTATSVAGCGLGLSIVRHVAGLHQARLAIEDSRFASGTRVIVAFPRDVVVNA